MPPRHPLARAVARAIAAAAALLTLALVPALVPASRAGADACVPAAVSRGCPIVSGTTDPGGVTLTATASPGPSHPSTRPARPARSAAPRPPGAPAPAPRSPRSTRPPRSVPRPPATVSVPTRVPAPAPARSAGGRRVLLDTVCESVEVSCGGLRRPPEPQPARVPGHQQRGPAGVPAAPDGPGTPGPPLPTLVDIVRVAGEASAARMQPDGWAVAGAPTAFLADAAPRTRDVVLLGQQASVRLTPTRYHWSFGDGSGLDTDDPGVRWSQGEHNAFTAGPTTHVFVATGALRAQLVTEYRAEYRYAGGAWRSLPGTLSLAAAPLRFTVLKAKTLLVADDCSENLAGPGCPSR